MMTWSKGIVVSLALLWLSGCATPRFELGMNADLSNAQLINHKEVELWVGPVTAPNIKNDHFPKEAHEYLERDLRESIVKNLRAVESLKTSWGETPPKSADYSLTIQWNQYDVESGTNPAVFLAGPFFIVLIDTEISQKVTCRYQAELELKNHLGEKIISNSAAKSAEFTTTMDGDWGAMTEKDDLCYQARSYVMEQLLRDMLMAINQQQ